MGENQMWRGNNELGLGNVNHRMLISWDGKETACSLDVEFREQWESTGKTNKQIKKTASVIGGCWGYGDKE